MPQTTKGQLEESIHDLLLKLGAGLIGPVAYDTAWVARLAAKYPGKGFEDSFRWLRAYQHDDGSWGSPVFHSYDRVVSTLAALVAFASGPTESGDEYRIKKAITFLWKVCGSLPCSPRDTAGFPLIANWLAGEALRYGLDVPRQWCEDISLVEAKLRTFKPELLRHHTLSFSYEALEPYLPRSATVLEANGAVAASPAATAALLLHAPQQKAWRFLEETVEGDGGVAHIRPIDIYEISWALNSFRAANLIEPDDPVVRALLDRLWAAWNPQFGVSFSSFFAIYDVDCTAATFALLKWGGYDVQPDVFAHFDEGRWFAGYVGESTPSVSVNIRVLLALRMIPQTEQTAQWSAKIILMLHQEAIAGCFWHDKWHISPYYSTCAAVPALDGIDDELAERCLNWIRRTQHPDGGWGFHGYSTAEETAYCLQALVTWQETHQHVDKNMLDAAARFLEIHIQPYRDVPMNIAKCVFYPVYIVQAAKLAALHAYYQALPNLRST